MLLKEYLKDKLGIDVTTKEGKLSFCENLFRECSYKYSGTCADYDIDVNSEQGKEYEAAYDFPCLYVSAQDTKTGSFEFEGEFFKVMGISQRLAGRLKCSNKNGKGADLNVLFDADMVINEWEDEEGSHRALQLRCKANQKKVTCIKFKIQNKGPERVLLF